MYLAQQKLAIADQDLDRLANVVSESLFTLTKLNIKRCKMNATFL